MAGKKLHALPGIINGRCFMNGTNETVFKTEGEVVAIDGKTSRCSDTLKTQTASAPGQRIGNCLDVRGFDR